MGINHARSAHAGLNEARLVMQHSLSEGASNENVAKFEKLIRNTFEDLSVVRERVQSSNVKAAREKVEGRLRDWSDAGLKILKPVPGGLASIPTTFSLTQQSDAVAAALDDLVELVAAYGFDYRAEAEATVAAARTTMLGIAVGTVLVGFMLAIAFAYSLSRPISAAMHVAERVAAGNFTDDIAVRRSDELGRLLKSLAVMQASLKARADDDLALMSSKDETNAQQVSRRQRIEAEIEAFRSTFTSHLANTDRMTGELTDTAQTLSSIAHAAGQQSIETASTAGETSANVQTVATAASQLGDSVHAIKTQINDATVIVQRASGMAGTANDTIGALANAAAAHRRSRGLHPDHRRADQSAGVERYDRGGARRRSRTRICGRRIRSEGAGDPDRQGNRRNILPDRRSAIGDPAGSRQCWRHCLDHGRDRQLYLDDCCRRRRAGCRRDRNIQEHRAGRRRNGKRRPKHRRHGRRRPRTPIVPPTSFLPPHAICRIRPSICGRRLIVSCQTWRLDPALCRMIRLRRTGHVVR